MAPVFAKADGLVTLVQSMTKITVMRYVVDALVPMHPTVRIVPPMRIEMS